MIYKTSLFNYSMNHEKELLIVNFKKGLSSFRIVSGGDIEIVRNYISAPISEINTPNNIEKNLIDGDGYVFRVIEYSGLYIRKGV